MYLSTARGKIGCSVLLLLSLCLPNFAAAHKLQKAITQSIAPQQLQGYEKYPPAVKMLIFHALQMTKQDLTYCYGSADPKNRGMDCSGTLYYLLKRLNVHDVPRSSREMYLWSLRKGKFHASKHSAARLCDYTYLKPGDLLFWAGTYKTRLSPPISHVMLYLGKNKQGQTLMFGSSDGRTYRGKKMWGVSVFDFLLPNYREHGRFVGYGCIPGINCR